MYLVYNTADVIDEAKIDYGYGLGIKPNLIQTVEKLTIGNLEVLKYLDEDGTIHYFYKKTNENTNKFYDEDGLGLTLELKENCYIMTDKDSNTNKFVKHTLNNKDVYFLEEVKDTNNKTIKVVYDNNKISKVIDASNNEINITYEEDKISFISPYKTVIANYTDNKLTSIEDLGDTETIEYNSNNLIEKIINSNGLSMKYEYISELSFKVSKVTEYSMTGTEGNYLEFTYNLKSTTIKDRKGHVNTYVFNHFGNVETVSNLDEEEDLSNAYGKAYVYGEEDTSSVNKLVLSSQLIKNTNNIIDYIDLTGENTLNCSSGIQKTYIPNSKESIFNFNIDKSNWGQEDKIYGVFDIQQQNYITLSFMAKGNGRADLTFYNGSLVTREDYDFELTDQFKRYIFTYDMRDGTSPRMNMYITPFQSTEIIIKNIQLEFGPCSSGYNLFNDGSFQRGSSEFDIKTVKRVGRQKAWNVEETTNNTEIVSINNTKALKFKNNPLLNSTLTKNFSIAGKQGDVFELSFWYKNEGLKEDARTFTFMKFNYTKDVEDDENGKETALTDFNNDWHFFSKKIVAKEDYDSLTFTLNNYYNINDFYITNISLYKDLESYSYVYDDEGNLVSSVDLSKETSQFAYNSNNQLIQATTPKGANYKFEYDDNVTDRLIRAISPSGITNAIDYDDNNNPIKTVVNNTQAFDDIMDTIYYIRARGTDDYMYINDNKTLRVKQCECSHDKFNVLLQPNGHVKLEFSIMPNYYLKDNNGALKIEYGDNNNLFELIKHTNKSYSIKSTYSNLAVTVNNDKSLSLTTYDESNANQQFLFERMESSLFIEASAKYTEDGRFIKSVKDSVGNVTKYDINPTNGLTRSITDAKGNKTYYTYDEKFRTTKISDAFSISGLFPPISGPTIPDKPVAKVPVRKVEYEYDTKNNLVNIKHGTKNYKFEYDEFNRRKNTKINDRLLSENYYEDNNGNLSKVKYGNGSEISYTYDSYDRVKTIKKDNETCTNYYDNFGRIGRTEIGGATYEYKYDFAGRISTYSHNGRTSSYDYDKDNNIIKKIDSSSFYNTYTYTYSYNNDSALTNMNVLNSNFNYNYDKLGRLTESNINNQYKTSYNYITRGKKTSIVVDKVNDNGIEYAYTYDSLGNIIEVKKDNIITNKYTYDKHSQLTKEDNLINNKTIKYTYDTYGNILSKKEYVYNTENLINEDKYEYTDSSWQDLLTKFNDESITYDEIGNPLTIGNKTLTWKNGRELSTYNDGTNSISYEYDVNGIRTSKVVNGKLKRFYLNGTSILFEESVGSMLYYIYGNGGLVGFHYDNNTYYYHKNIFNDIIGIFDSNFNEIVTYEYDSWGAILNVTDNSNINLGTINPFRYRSYYYDEETGLYYLNSRYYSPTKRRFLKADSLITGQGFNGNNLFSYCNNSPVVNLDIEGHFIFTAIAIGGLIGFGGRLLSNYINGRELHDGLARATIVGMISGAFGGVAMGCARLVTSSQFAINFIGQLATNLTSAHLSYLTNLSTAEETLKAYCLAVPFSAFGASVTTLIDTSIKNELANNFVHALSDYIIAGGISYKEIFEMPQNIELTTGEIIPKEVIKMYTQKSTQPPKTFIPGPLYYENFYVPPYSNQPYLAKNQYDMLKYIRSTKMC